MFRLSESPIDSAGLHRQLASTQAGACVVFEGWVRDHNAGRGVLRLSYQAYPAMAEQQGGRIVAAVAQRQPILAALCVHRVGELQIGDLAVWVGVSAAHRDAAFLACRDIIDQIKRDVPIWKNEHYVDGDSGWLHPEAG